MAIVLVSLRISSWRPLRLHAKTLIFSNLGIGPCYDYEYHLNNDIALAQWQYYLVTKNETWLEEKGYPIMQHVSEFWAGHVMKNDTTG